MVNPSRLMLFSTLAELPPFLHPRVSVNVLRSQNLNPSLPSQPKMLELQVQELVVRGLAGVDVVVGARVQLRRPPRSLIPRWPTTGRPVQMVVRSQQLLNLLTATPPWMMRSCEALMEFQSLCGTGKASDQG